MADDKRRFDPQSYKTEWIACKDLSVVWVQAQRRLDEKRAQAIANDFDPDLFTPCKVTKPNCEGKYHICDGQHGVRAVVILWGENQKVPCLVSEEGDPEKAAELFLRTNTGRKPPSKIDHFKVSVTAKRPTELAIDRIVRGHGYRVDNSSAADAISAVTALRTVYSVASPRALDAALKAIRGIWGEDHDAVKGIIIRGLGFFLNEFGRQIDWKRFTEVTAKRWTPGNLERDAKATHDLQGLSTTDAIVQLLLQHYNKGLRGSTKPLKRKEPAKSKEAADA